MEEWGGRSDEWAHSSPHIYSRMGNINICGVLSPARERGRERGAQIMPSWWLLISRRRYDPRQIFEMPSRPVRSCPYILPLSGQIGKRSHLDHLSCGIRRIWLARTTEGKAKNKRRPREWLCLLYTQVRLCASYCFTRSSSPRSNPNPQTNPIHRVSK